jgi:lipoate---protein ligase
MGRCGQSYLLLSVVIFSQNKIQTTEIKSKHGIILSCSFSHDGASDLSVDREILELSKALEGMKYGFLNAAIEARAAGGRNGDIWEWLKIAMES